MGIYKTPKDAPANGQPPRVKTRLLDGGEASQDAPRESIFPRTGASPRPEPGAPPGRGPNLTRLVAPGAARSIRDPVIDAAADPVAGWLVVVKGPGRGAFRPVGYQVNRIGRDPNIPDNRIVLDFGDKTISRERHASIVYDPRTRVFYLERGDGANLCYLNDRPVGRDLIEIPPQARISLGETECVLVPFCGPHFDWSDATYPFGQRTALESGQ